MGTEMAHYRADRWRREHTREDVASTVEEKFEMYEHEREGEEWRRSGESKKCQKILF